MSSSSSSSGVDLQRFFIPLKEIKSATRNFSPETRINQDRNKKGDKKKVFFYYKGQLSNQWENRTAVFKRKNRKFSRNGYDYEGFRKMSLFQHENIIRFIGYCDEGDETITVFEYASNGSLNHHLLDTGNNRKLTWEQRLKICIGVATGLKYLHLGYGEDTIAVHGGLSSIHILLQENMEAKLSGLQCSVLVSKDPQKNNNEFDSADPTCVETSSITPEADIYSFGMLLFEMISGRLSHNEQSLGNSTREPLITWIRYYQDDGPEILTDPIMRGHIHRSSLNSVIDIAYKCISFNIKERPTFDIIIKTIGEALDIHIREPPSIVGIHNRRLQNPTDSQISLTDIKLATETFGENAVIKRSFFSMVYSGQFSVSGKTLTAAVKRRRVNSPLTSIEFFKEIEMMSSFDHQNIIPFVGYCEEDNEMIIVSEYATNGSLDLYLHDPNKRKCLTWVQRLKICLGAARGLKYLHSGLGDRGKVLHGDFKSARILLDDNMEAKLCGFCSSIQLPKDQAKVIRSVQTTEGYTDPVYAESKMVKTEKDVYSFGVVMFELLSGMLAAEPFVDDDDFYHLAYHKWSSEVGKAQTLMRIVRTYCDAEPYILVDPCIKDQVDMKLLKTFRDLAYRCISFNLKERPSMNRIIKTIEDALKFQNDGAVSTMPSHQNQNLKDFFIPKKEIDEAIKDSNQAGYGGSCLVYKIQLSENRLVAIKRLKSEGCQGKKEFLNELELLFSLCHENVIPFIGYCDEDDEMILITEYAENGSLDDYLEVEENRKCLTWEQRLKICLGAARGLHYLHSGCGKAKKVVHGDVKSANILLDDKLNAKICDFGLSKSGPAYQADTVVYTNIIGTDFYRDPSHRETGSLGSASDVYSFGVVLFEMLCGFLAYRTKENLEDHKKQHLISLVRRYHAKGVDKLIDVYIKEEIDDDSLNTFKDMAYECIDLVQKNRPTMDNIIDRLEQALEYHRGHQEGGSKQKKRRTSSDPDKQKLNVAVLGKE